MQGRDFSEADGPGAPDVAIVNETAARRIWPAESALGRTLLQDDAPPGAPSRARTLRIVGVVRDGKYRSLDEPPRAFVWVPFRQQYVPRVMVVARGRGGRRAADALRAASASAGPPLLRLERLEDAASAGLLPQRIARAASTALGAVGLLLAAIGVYGVTAYAVSRRTREIAVRIAVGAAPGEIVRMVLRGSVSLAGAGVAIGLALSAAASGLFRSLLFGVPPLDLHRRHGAPRRGLGGGGVGSGIPGGRDRPGRRAAERVTGADQARGAPASPASASRAAAHQGFAPS